MEANICAWASQESEKEKEFHFWAQRPAPTLSQGINHVLFQISLLLFADTWPREIIRTPNPALGVMLCSFWVTVSGESWNS